MSTPLITTDTERWELVVKAEIPAEHIEQHRAHVLQELKKTVTIDGFRPGKAPDERIVQAVGMQEILRRTIEHTVHHELPEILAREKANIVAAPQVVVESAPQSLPADTPIIFTARAPLAPKVELPDYAEIARRHNSHKADVAVTDEEHTQTMTHLRRERARITKVELGLPPAEAADAAQKMSEADLPPLDDDFVKTLGYESADAFAAAVRENIKTEKELRETDKRRAGLLDELVEKTTVSYPRILREYELDDMEARLKQDLESMHTTLERYLAETKKTPESLREEWSNAADKRAKLRLVLAKIAEAERIEVPTERLDNEVIQAKKHFPAANEDNLRAHIHHTLRNEAVIKWLETQV